MKKLLFTLVIICFSVLIYGQRYIFKDGVLVKGSVKNIWESDPATFNLRLGTGAGFSVTSGAYNTFTGYKSGYSNLASSNTFYGSNSGYSNTTGKFNTFIGDSTGFANTIGRNNTVVGYSSGAGLVDGIGNVFAGYNSGKAVTSGNYNILIGHYAGQSITTGMQNVAIGTFANYYLSSGNANLTLGFNAMRMCQTGSNNIALGNQALYNGYVIQQCIALGGSAGFADSISTNNTYLGYNTGGYIDPLHPGRHITASGRVLIGNEVGSLAADTVDNILMIDNSATSTPLIYGNFADDTVRINGTLSLEVPTLYNSPDTILSYHNGAVTITTTADGTNIAATAFGCSLDGQGGVIATGVADEWTAPYNGTIIGWQVTSPNDVAGTISIDTWEGTYAGYPPVVGGSIWSGAYPGISVSGTKAQSGALSIAIHANDIFRFNVISCTSITKCNLIIFVTKN